MSGYMRLRPLAVGAFGLGLASSGLGVQDEGLHHFLTVNVQNVSAQDLVISGAQVLGNTVWSQGAAAESGVTVARQDSSVFAMASTDANTPTEGRILLSTPSGAPVMVYVTGGGASGTPVATVTTGHSGLACSIQINGCDVTISLSSA